MSTSDGTCGEGRKGEDRPTKHVESHPGGEGSGGQYPEQDSVKGSVFPNGCAVLTINRPKALNAMNLSMDEGFKSLLQSWSSGGTSAPRVVLVEGSTPRAFSSGADVKWMTTAGRREMGTHALAVKVFSAEYSLICKIARFSLPYFSIMDGITMGFGIGLSAHGRFRVITERTVLAMPENAIGLFPDVGFAHIAARSPSDGAVGLFLALTGFRTSTPADAIFAGIGTHFVPSSSLPALREALLSHQFASSATDSSDAVEEILKKFSEEVDFEKSTLRRIQPWISKYFGPLGTSLQDTISRLESAAASSADENEVKWASETLAGIRAVCPFSVAVTHRHFSAVAAAVASSSSASHPLSTIEGVMKVEYRLAMRTSTRGDFVEGVRAVLVDKDHKPRWSLSTLDDLDSEEVEALFSPFEDPSHELKL